VAWERAAHGAAHRLYLWWDGTHRAGAEPAAVRVVERLASHPERASRSSVLLGDGTAAQARRLDRVCLN
jgi:hypothetical protein